MKYVSFLIFNVFVCFCFCFLMLEHDFGILNSKVAAIDVDNADVIPAKSAIVMEKISKRVLFEQNAYERLPMASTTKIITAIVAIENNANIDRIFEIPSEAVGVPGSSVFLEKGEHLSIKNLLFGLMLPSGNDAAVALAIATCGSVEKFADISNAFCKKIGAVNTHVVNPHGLHDDEHFTTAFDLALISSYALTNPVFREIVSTKKTVIPKEFDKDKHDRLLKNKNRLLQDFEGASGVKTGYTKKAGRCLVSSAERNGMELVCVVLNCDPMFEESEKLLETAFKKFSLVEVLEPYFHVGSVKVNFGDQKTINLFSKKGFFFPVTQNEKSMIRVVSKFPVTISAPVKKGAVVGEISIFCGNDLIFLDKIYTMEESESIKIKDIFMRIFSEFVG